MTDAELNERLARALGWRTIHPVSLRPISTGKLPKMLPEIWVSPGGIPSPNGPPDFVGKWRHCGPLMARCGLSIDNHDPANDGALIFKGVRIVSDIPKGDRVTDAALRRAICEAALKVLEGDNDSLMLESPI